MVASGAVKFSRIFFDLGVGQSYGILPVLVCWSSLSTRLLLLKAYSFFTCERVLAHSLVSLRLRSNAMHLLQAHFVAVTHGGFVVQPWVRYRCCSSPRCHLMIWPLSEEQPTVVPKGRISGALRDNRRSGLHDFPARNQLVLKHCPPYPVLHGPEENSSEIHIRLCLLQAKDPQKPPGCSVALMPSRPRR